MAYQALLVLLLYVSVFRSEIQEHIVYAVFHDGRRFVFPVADVPIHNLSFNDNADIHVIPRLMVEDSSSLLPIQKRFPSLELNPICNTYCSLRHSGESDTFDAHHFGWRSAGNGRPESARSLTWSIDLWPSATMLQA